MKRPSICFMGDEMRCDKVMESFGADIKGFYVKRKRAQKNIIAEKQPVCVCIILEKGKSAAADHYSEAFVYSKRTRCPIYVICSPDQFYGIKNSYPEHHLHKMNVSGLYKAIRRIIEIFSKYGDKADFEIAKSRFETVEIHSKNASIAAYCADKVLNVNRSGYRIIVTASKELHSVNPLMVITSDGAVSSNHKSAEVPIVSLDITSDNPDNNSDELIADLLSKRKKALIKKLNS